MWLLNNGVCPLLQTKIPLESTSLDHIHKLKHEPVSEQKGTIRNTIEFRANCMEGKITNAWSRMYGSDSLKHPITLPNFLRNLADYLEQGAYINNGAVYIHPTEKPKLPIVSKKNYNKLKKIYIGRKKFPEYPKSKKLTKNLKVLFQEYNIEPYN